jgi:hypothetical protein
MAKSASGFEFNKANNCGVYILYGAEASNHNILNFGLAIWHIRVHNRSSSRDADPV